jgi:hypothetical protein
LAWVGIVTLASQDNLQRLLSGPRRLGVYTQD